MRNSQKSSDWILVMRCRRALSFERYREKVPAYSGMRYPLLKDETNPVQAKYEVGQPDVQIARCSKSR